jgi:hypothetical protein
MLKLRLSSIPEKKGHTHFRKFYILETFEDGSCIAELDRKYLSNATLTALRDRGVEKIEVIKMVEEKGK